VSVFDILKTRDLPAEYAPMTDESGLCMTLFVMCELLVAMHLQIYSIVQLSIYGWQMAAIKYEKDRAANTLLPDYNTYGRFDSFIPSYYESYYQSPQERFYIGSSLLLSAFLSTRFYEQ
jgi:hypothetical protein